MIETLKNDLKKAILAKKDIEKSTLRVLLGEIERNGIKEEDKIISTINKLIASNNETLSYADSRILEEENAILYSYLPKYLSSDEIAVIISAEGPLFDKIREAKSEGQAIGLAMKFLKSQNHYVRGGDVTSIVNKIREK